MTTLLINDAPNKQIYGCSECSFEHHVDLDNDGIVTSRKTINYGNYSDHNHFVSYIPSGKDALDLEIGASFKGTS